MEGIDADIILDVDGETEKISPSRTEDPKRTYVLYVLDRSGSMMSLRQIVVDGFNEHLREIKRQAKKGGDTRVGLVVFSETPQVQMWNARAEDVRILRLSEYEPNGSTAMLDALGVTLEKARSLPGYTSPTASFLCIILSDGYENASRTETYDTIRTKIEGLQETGRWEFAYIGSNQDLSKVQENTGINSSVMFAATPQGMASVSGASSGALQGYFNARAAGGQSAAGTYAADTQSLYDQQMGVQTPNVAETWGAKVPEKKPKP